MVKSEDKLRMELAAKIERDKKMTLNTKWAWFIRGVVSNLSEPLLNSQIQACFTILCDLLELEHLSLLIQ